MLNSRKRNYLNGPQTYQVTRWIEDHRAEVETMTTEEIADALTKAKGILVTEQNAKSACESAGCKWSSKRSRKSSTRAHTKSATKQIRYLAAATRRLAKQVGHLYTTLGTEIPQAMRVDFGVLSALATGYSSLVTEDNDEHEGTAEE